MKTLGAVLAISADAQERKHTPIDPTLPRHVASPLRPDAFDLTNEEKIAVISARFRDIMQTLGLDLTDDSLKGTPLRVAKMYVNEVFNGLDPKVRPEATLFDNTYGYTGMLVEHGIGVNSFCEHHFVPIIGKAAVAYFSSGKVIGLSKLDRIVKYYAARPQVQERLTEQIAAELKHVLETDDVAVHLEAEHMCVRLRGVKDETSRTNTVHFSGRFQDPATQDRFLAQVRRAE